MLTAVAPARSVPVIVTAVPPAVVPDIGLIALTIGGSAKVKNVFAAFVREFAVTFTLNAPATCAGVVAVIVVSLTIIIPVAAVPPIFTAVAPVNPVPVIVMLVPPASGPLPGTTPVTVGAAPQLCAAVFPFRGLTATAVKLVLLTSVSVQNRSRLLRSTVWLLGAGAGPAPSKQFVVAP